MKKESSKERSNKESRKNIPPPLIPSPLAKAMGMKSEEEAMSSTGMKSEEEAKSSTRMKSVEEAKSSTRMRSEEEAMSSTGMRSEEESMSSTRMKSEEEAKSSTGMRSEEEAMSSTMVREAKAEKQIDIAAFLRFFEAARREFHSTLPAVRWLSPGQRQSLQILYSKYGCEGVRETVIKFCRSSFINGRRGPTRRQFTLFWLFYEDNFLKTMGGAYDDPALPPALQAAAERREARRQWMETNRRLYEEEKERERAQREQSVSRAITYEEWVEMNGGHKIEVPD